MARLAIPVALPDLFGPDGFFGHDRAFQALREASDAARDAGQVVGRLIRFQIADGYAWYRVEATRPLTLAHVPFGDAYTAQPALIRGLTLADVTAMLDREDRISALFRSRS